MATKRDCPCLQKVADDEPIFVLRAQDKLAPQLVTYWAHLVERYYELPENHGLATLATMNKLAEARQCAEAMWAWQDTHGSKIPD